MPVDIPRKLARDNSSKTTPVMRPFWIILVGRRFIQGGIRFGRPGVGRGMSPKRIRMRQPPAGPIRVPARRVPVLGQRTHPGVQLTHKVGQLFQTLRAANSKGHTFPSCAPASSEGINAIFPLRLKTPGLQTSVSGDIPHFVPAARISGRHLKGFLATSNPKQNRDGGSNSLAR